MERAKGIEPSCAVWKTAVLPLNYARKGCMHHTGRPWLVNFAEAGLSRAWRRHPLVKGFATEARSTQRGGFIIG